MTKQSLADIARKKRHLHLIEKLHQGKPLSKQEITELESFEAEPLPAAVVRTQEEVAKVMDVSYRTVNRWKKDGMPTTPEGYFDLDRIREWHARRQDKSSIQEGKDFWDEKIKKYKAGLLELELKKMTGELVARSEVEEGRVTRVITIKRTLLALPTRLAPVLAMKEPREIETVLYEALSEIVDEFAGTERSNDGLVAAGETGVETGGEDNGQPVG